jgi:hypothetical protein
MLRNTMLDRNFGYKLTVETGIVGLYMRFLDSTILNN